MDKAGLGIYVHWPFCRHLCPYCDFNSYLLEHFDETQWLEAYENAIEYWSDYRKGEKITSIYFGGGTPSTSNPKIIGGIIEKISSIWNIDTAEITLEANPTSVEAEKFKGFSDAGVNRLSIGFQALNNEALKSLGRMHNVRESLHALDIARLYFPRTNFDIIYARQNQTVQDWEIELKQIIKLNPSHISLYQLTIEPDTVFGQMHDKNKLKGLPSGETAETMFRLTRDMLRSNGFEHYEISNFAKQDEKSRHNLIYWNYDDYIGIGPGAHGRISDRGRIATYQKPKPNDWLVNPVHFEMETLTAEQQAMEYILMAMRLESGIHFEKLDQLGFKLPIRIIETLKSQKLIIKDNIGIRATDHGRLVLNHIIEKLTT